MSGMFKCAVCSLSKEKVKPLEWKERGLSRCNKYILQKQIRSLTGVKTSQIQPQMNNNTCSITPSGSSWQRTEDKSANIQRLGWENYPWRLKKEKGKKEMYEACLRQFRQKLIFILIRNVKFPFVPYLLISMYACTCFNKSLQLFPIFVEQKMNDIKKWVV